MTSLRPDEITEVRVGALGGDYPVFVGTGGMERIGEYLDEHAPAHNYAIISDHTVAPLYGQRVLASCIEAGHEAALYTFPAGEASKTRKSWSILTDELLEAGYGRDTCVIAVGGGVTGDLGGFVAATYLRGVPVVQVPTSYLAMIDASVGGKTGVDVRAGKNLVGAFHPPRCVIADPTALETLPETERAQGLVEAFKHGAILDAEYFDQLVADSSALLTAESDVASRSILQSVRLKASVVTRDEREGGYRQILNFGHTLGHAIEAASDFQVGHGTAVAVGMLLEAELGERLEVTESGTQNRIAEGLATLGFDRSSAGHVDVQAAMAYLVSDKKARSGRPRYVLLRRLGETEEGEGWAREVPETLVKEVLGELQ
jgi:3-dehydroquinate synthase